MLVNEYDTRNSVKICPNPLTGWILVKIFKKLDITTQSSEFFYKFIFFGKGGGRAFLK